MTDWFSKTPAEKMMDTMLRKHPVYGYQDTPKEFFPGQGGVPSIYQGSVSTLDPLGGIYGGERAVGANVGLLEKAKKWMHGVRDVGKLGEATRKRTGWFKGMDKKWRFEIDDSKANFTKGFTDHVAESYMDIGFDAGVRIGDVIDHPELFNAYPNLKNIPVKLEYNIWKKPSGGSFSPKGIEVRYKDISEVKPVLIHEIQHAVQEIEGFAKGGSPEGMKFQGVIPSRLVGEANQLLTLSERHDIPIDEILKNPPEYLKDIKEESVYLAKEGRARVDAEMKAVQEALDPTYGYNRYKRLAGEIEARDAADRMRLTVKERIKKAPKLRHDAIVRETK